MRPDRPRPTFTEDGYHIFNRYRPQVHPIEGGDLAPFEAFFARLFPDATERTWCWNYLAHKTRRPWVPMIGVIMVAEEFGTGRGTLFEILALLFGREYVVPCTFGELTGTSAAARFNARLADALFVVVNEAVAEDGHQQTQRRLHYDALKNVVDPSPTQRRRFEAKQQHAYAQTSAASTIIATNHRDVVKLPRDDRRIEVLSCGRKMTAAERVEIREWMADPKNIGALHRALLATPAAPLEVFDPYGVPRVTPSPSWVDPHHGYLNAPIDPSTGTTLLGARTYSVALGRFLSVDPLLNSADPQSINGWVSFSR